jgi:hypothetical protein
MTMRAIQSAAEALDDREEGLHGQAGGETRLRLPLRSAQDVRRELAKIHRDGKSGRRGVSDVSKLANILQILGRMIETSDLEARIEKLEAAK